MLKGTKIYSIVALKCPKCHSANLFENNNIFNIKTIYDMHKSCPNCGQDFVIEIGFYWGSMYISYIVTSFLLFFLIGLDILFTGYLTRTRMFVYIGFTLLIWGYIFRISRSIWINFWVHYDKNIGER